MLTDRVMRKILLAWLLMLPAAPALADQKCDYGSPDVFEFVRWSFDTSTANAALLEMTITYHNRLDVALKAHEIRIIVEDNAFGFRREEPVTAGGEATYKETFDMPQDLAARFRTLTPLLCTTGIEDETGKQTTYP
jgi:hypothetical protein